MRLHLLFTAMGLHFFLQGNAQEVPLPTVPDSLLKARDTEQVILIGGDPEAEFPGGFSALSQFIAENTVYPQEAIDAHVEGKVFVRFIVDSTGRIEEPEVVRSVSPELDAEALRVVGLMPDWSPAIDNGEYVRTWVRLPFVFVLDDGEEREK